MSTRSVPLAALALALASTACQPPAQEAGLSEEDVAAIQELFQRYDDTVNAGDAETWMTLITDDVLWMAPNQAMLVGKEAVRTRVQPFFEQQDLEHTTTLQEVEGAGEWAFVRGTYTFRVTPKAGGETSEEAGKFIYILGRQSDSSWKVARAICLGPCH